MVSHKEASLIFSKWSEEDTPLLFRSHSPRFTHSILCGLDLVNDGTIRLRLQGFGHIEVRISAESTFEYFDPATYRDSPDDPAPPSPSEYITTGAGIVASHPSGESFLLLEILVT